MLLFYVVNKFAGEKEIEEIRERNCVCLVQEGECNITERDAKTVRDREREKKSSKWRVCDY